MVKIMEHPKKMDDLGVPLFLETPRFHGFVWVKNCSFVFERSIQRPMNPILCALELPNEKTGSFRLGARILKPETCAIISRISIFFQVICTVFGFGRISSTIYQLYWSSQILEILLQEVM